MQFSMTPVLVAVELAFPLMLALRAGPSVPKAPVFAYLFWLAAYAVATSVAGALGLFVDETLLKWLPGLWLQLVTVTAAVGPILFFPQLRQALRQIVDETPLHWFAWFHGLRIAALGTAYKTAIGEFPAYFEFLVGIPDLLFGISAFWIAAMVRRGTIGINGFLVWNLVGALIIVPSAPILLQLGLPGPLQVFTSLPDARAVYTYPMSIAPMFGVPFFVLVNLWVAWRLWERRQSQPALSG